MIKSRIYRILKGVLTIKNDFLFFGKFRYIFWLLYHSNTRHTITFTGFFSSPNTVIILLAIYFWSCRDVSLDQSTVITIKCHMIVLLK